MSPPSPQPTPASLTVPTWAAATVGAGVALTFLCVAMRPGIFMVDDAWFYLQIGRNLAAGLGSTFDGVTPTNGYHPLWQGLVGLLALVDSEGLLGLATLVQVGFVGAALAGAYQLARNHAAPWPIAVPLAMLLTQYSAQGWLSEGPITAALLVAALSSQGLVCGVFLGLLFLCRLDTVFFIAAFLALHPQRLRIVPGLLIATPWLAWNVTTFGHLVPVSGAIKSTFPLPEVSNPISKIGWTGVGTFLGSLLACGLAVRSPRRLLLGSLGLGAAAHALYTFLFTGALWSTFVPYYWIVGTLASGFAAGELLQFYLGFLPSLTGSARRTLLGAMASVLALSAAGRAIQSVFAEPDPVVELGTWIGENLPDSTVLVLDAPGRLAWFSRRPVIAMDGLTRTYTFSDEVTEDFEGWVKRQGVTHLVTYDHDIELPWCRRRGSEVFFKAPKTGAEVGSIQVAGPGLKRLVDFVPADENMATLHRWPSE